jgi:hypothetical protein
MKIEFIQNRIDNNILSLLENLSIRDCIQNLTDIQTRFQQKVQGKYDQIESILKIESARERYTWIYIQHTKQRIKQLEKIDNLKDFKLILYREKLTKQNSVPIVHSIKYRNISLTES